MKSFNHAIWLSLKYKWTIFGSVLSSLAIALLWGASISTVFPIVKIVLEGQTAQMWIDAEIEGAKSEQKKLTASIDDLQVEIQQAKAANRAELQKKLRAVNSRLEAEGKALAWFTWVKPTIDKFAPDSPFSTLVMAMVWLLTTSIIKGFLLVLSTILVSRVANRTVLDMQRIYYRKALELDQQTIDRMGTSTMMTHLSNNMGMISGGLRALYGKSLREPFKMITCLIGAAMISLPLLLISLVVIPAGAVVITGISRRMKKSMQSELGGIAAVFQTLIESLSWLKTVRIFNREGTERKRFKKNATVLYRMSMRIALYDSLLRPITEVLGIIAITMSILAGSWLVLNQTTMLFGFQILDRPLKPSMLVLFYTMLAGASDPGRKMSEIVNILVRGGTACENLQQAYNAVPSIRTPDNSIPVPLHSESIEFRNLSFCYSPQQPVLKEINLVIPFGQTVAIVGGNGCGKTTLMNLLARFYDPQTGQVLIDGKPIHLMNPKRLRRQIAWVTQQSVLFRGTVWENIAYGAKRATAYQIKQAAETARVTDFLPKLSNGFDSQVGDNGNQLSAGQRQRVALARAVLADPRIFILDEATSQMDGNTEGLVHESLTRFTKNRTTFVVTHRSSSLKLADRVIVMDHGEIKYDDTVSNTRNDSEHFQFLFAKSA